MAIDGEKKVKKEKSEDKEKKEKKDKSEKGRQFRFVNTLPPNADNLLRNC